jgi:hypothetical protein
MLRKSERTQTLKRSFGANIGLICGAAVPGGPPPPPIPGPRSKT